MLVNLQYFGSLLDWFESGKQFVLELAFAVVCLLEEHEDFALNLEVMSFLNSRENKMHCDLLTSDLVSC